MNQLSTESYFTPTAVCISLRVPPSNQSAFLISHLKKEMTGMDNNSLFTNWFLMVSPKQIEIHVNPRNGVSSESLAQKIMSSLQPGLSEMGGQFFLRDDLPLKYMNSRLGGQSGRRINLLFQIKTRELILDLIDLEASSEVTAYELILGSTYFFLQTLGVERPLWKKGVEEWIQNFSNLLESKGKQGAGEAIRKTAELEFGRNSGLLNFLEQIDRKGWTAALTPSHSRIFTKCEPDIRRIGRALKSFYAAPQRTKLWPDTFFHSYLHLHLMALGFGNMKELLTLNVLNLYLNRAPNKGT